MFAIGFVPDRDDIDALFESHHEGAQLSFGFLCESVADADRKFLELKSGLLDHIERFVSVSKFDSRCPTVSCANANEFSASARGIKRCQCKKIKQNCKCCGWQAD